MTKIKSTLLLITIALTGCGGAQFSSGDHSADDSDSGTGGKVALHKPDGTGGAVGDEADSGTSTGGTVQETGGSPGTGGTTEAGGSGGEGSTGGTTADSGGSPGTGGAETGGTTENGGTTSTGGVTSSGGTASTGGTPGSGGTTSTGGTTGSGGVTGTGTGGTPGSGGTVSTGGTTSTGGSDDAGPHDPQPGDHCTGTVSACFDGNWLVCNYGTLITNNICTFGCTPEGSYADVACQKYVGQNLAVGNDLRTWNDDNNSWAMVHPTTSGETLTPCASVGPSYHLATFDEMLKLRDYNTDSSGNAVGNTVDGFSWFDSMTGGGLAIATGTPATQFGTYVEIVFPDGGELSYSPSQAQLPGTYFLCVK